MGTPRPCIQAPGLCPRFPGGSGGGNRGRGGEARASTVAQQCWTLQGSGILENPGWGRQMTKACWPPSLGTLVTKSGQLGEGPRDPLARYNRVFGPSAGRHDRCCHQIAWLAWDQSFGKWVKLFAKLRIRWSPFLQTGILSGSGGGGGWWQGGLGPRTAAGCLAGKESPWQVAAQTSRWAGPREQGIVPASGGGREWWGAGSLVVGTGKQSWGSSGRIGFGA